MKYKILYLVPLLAVALIFNSCKDNLENETFQAYENTAIGEYMKKSEEKFKYSTFLALLEKANMYNAVNLDFFDVNKNRFLSEHSYTVFAPTDAAFELFFEEKSFPNGLADVDTAFARAICQYHIIVPLETGLRLDATSFYPGVLKDKTVSEDRLIMKIGNLGTEEAWINDAKITSKMVDCRNGALYSLDAVLDPPLNIASYVATQLKHGPKGTLTIFHEALIATGYQERLSVVSKIDTIPSSLLPVKMNYNYTLFAVTDQVFKAKGINSFSELVARLGAESNYKDIDNALNKFIAYHMIDRKMTSRLLKIEPNIETMSAIVKNDYQVGDTIFNFEKIKISANGDQITLNDHTSAATNILSQNLCKNGVVLFVDNILDIQTAPLEEIYWEFNDNAQTEAYILGLGGYYRTDATGRLQSESSAIRPMEVPYYVYNNQTSKPFTMSYQDFNVDGIESAYASMRNKDILSIFSPANVWLEMYSPVLLPGEYSVDFSFLSIPKDSKAFAELPKVRFYIYYDDNQPAVMLNQDLISMYHLLTTNSLVQEGFKILENKITITEARKYRFRIEFSSGGNGSYHYFDHLRFEPIQP